MLTLQGKKKKNTPAVADFRLSLDGLTNGTHYIIDDQISGRLSVTPRRTLISPHITLTLYFVLSGKLQEDKVKVKTYHLSEQGDLHKSVIKSYDFTIPFHLGRPNFKGQKLDSHWMLAVDLDYYRPKKQRSITDRILSTAREKHTSTFIIPVRYGKGNYRVQPRKLAIPLFNEVAFGSVIFVSFALMVFLTLPKFGLEKSPLLYPSIGVLTLLFLIAYHFLRLTSFKQTPMKTTPARDGKIRIQYLNRGIGHFEGAEIGLRIKENRMAKDSTGKLDLGNGILYEKRMFLKDSSRPLGHLNEVILPWPDRVDEFPTSYRLGKTKRPHGYEWEVFLTTPIPFFGGNKEISWPINVTWERMRTTPPSPHELEEEKLELRELADNRLER